MHAVDYLNCSQGVSGVNAGQPYCPNLAKLGQTAVNYLDTSTSRPSDSFPGLMTIVSGATARLHGAFYDVAYDRVLAPPQNTTGNGLLAGPCTPNQPNSTSTEYDEGIDKNQTFLNGIDGISMKNGDGGINSIDPTRLVRDPSNNCAPVFPSHAAINHAVTSQGKVCTGEVCGVRPLSVIEHDSAKKTALGLGHKVAVHLEPHILASDRLASLYFSNCAGQLRDLFFQRTNPLLECGLEIIRRDWLRAGCNIFPSSGSFDAGRLFALMEGLAVGGAVAGVVLS